MGGAWNQGLAGIRPGLLQIKEMKKLTMRNLRNQLLSQYQENFCPDFNMVQGTQIEFLQGSQQALSQSLAELIRVFFISLHRS